MRKYNYISCFGAKWSSWVVSMVFSAPCNNANVYSWNMHNTVAWLYAVPKVKCYSYERFFSQFFFFVVIGRKLLFREFLSSTSLILWIFIWIWIIFFACFMFRRWCPLLISLSLSLSLSSIVVIGGSLSLRLSLSSSLIWVGSSFHSSQFAVAKSSSLFSYQGSHFIWCPLNPRPNFLTARIPSLRCTLNWSTLWSDIFKHGLLFILLPINLPITFSWCKVFPLTLPSVSIQYNNQRLNLLHFSFLSHNSVKLSHPNTCCHDNITQIYLISMYLRYVNSILYGTHFSSQILYLNNMRYL